MIGVAKKFICVATVISRMPKMCAIPQLGATYNVSTVTDNTYI